MPVLVEIQNSVAILTLSRPEGRNCWDEDFNEGLKQNLDQFAKQRDIRCIILTGDPAGRAFSAGANLKDANVHRSGSARDFIEGIPNWRQFVTQLLTEFPKPIIGAVNGYAIGIGCIAAFSCDLMVASDRAEWRLPQARLGILPAYGGSARIGRWMSQGQVMKLALGFPLLADDAYRIGAAQWLVPHDQLMKETLQIAQQIAELPPLAVRMVKESVISGVNNPNLAEAALADLYRFMVLEQTEDAREAHQAWREDRPARVSGK